MLPGRLCLGPPARLPIAQDPGFAGAGTQHQTVEGGSNGLGGRSLGSEAMEISMRGFYSEPRPRRRNERKACRRRFFCVFFKDGGLKAALC